MVETKKPIQKTNNKQSRGNSTVKGKKKHYYSNKKSNKPTSVQVKSQVKPVIKEKQEVQTVTITLPQSIPCTKHHKSLISSKIFTIGAAIIVTAVLVSVLFVMFN